jgi:hypothetical protein
MLRIRAAGSWAAGFAGQPGPDAWAVRRVDGQSLSRLARSLSGHILQPIDYIVNIQIKSISCDIPRQAPRSALPWTRPRQGLRPWTPGACNRRRNSPAAQTSGGGRVFLPILAAGVFGSAEAVCRNVRPCVSTPVGAGSARPLTRPGRPLRPGRPKPARRPNPCGSDAEHPGSRAMPWPWRVSGPGRRGGPGL